MSTEKGMIIVTFTVTFDGHFLPVQLIYGRKSSKSLPRANFPKSFSLDANSKHYSNEQELIKVLEEIEGMIERKSGNDWEWRKTKQHY